MRSFHKRRVVWGNSTHLCHMLYVDWKRLVNLSVLFLRYLKYRRCACEECRTFKKTAVHYLEATASDSKYVRRSVTICT